MRGLSLVVASGDHSSSRCAGPSLSRPLLLRSTGSRRAGSAVVAHGPSCSAACGIFPDQGSNPCPPHWQAGSQPLRHQGSPIITFEQFDYDMVLGVVFFTFLVLMAHWASWLSFHQICKNFYHYFLKYFFCPLFSFSSWFPITHILAAWSCFAHLFEVIYPYVYFVLDSFYFYVIKFTDVFFCNFKLPLTPTMRFSSYTMLFSSLGAGLGFFSVSSMSLLNSFNTWNTIMTFNVPLWWL